MPIQQGDIRIFKSDTMADTPDGGGEATLSEIISGVSNNYFDDVSTLDRIIGAIHMIKIYPHVFIQSLDKYYSGHSIISKLPKDTQIGVNLFSTDDYHDRRPEAQSRIENYIVQSSRYLGYLFSTQYRDSKVIKTFQHESAPIPSISDVLYLEQGENNQYVKVASVESSVETFTIGDRTFSRRIVTMETTQALQYDFVGSEISYEDILDPSANIYNTFVANAARYYSASLLAEPASAGDLSINVESVYSQLVPSSLQEVPNTNVNAINVVQNVIQASSESLSISHNASVSSSSPLYLGTPITPKTISLSGSGFELHDNGGYLYDGVDQIGQVSYSSGEITVDAGLTYYISDITYTPGAVEDSTANSSVTNIDATNRGNIYNLTVYPAPSEGSFQVDFMSFGGWNTLVSDGSGGLRGQEDGVGSGSVTLNNDGSASVVVTLSALPDVGSSIIWSWGSRNNYIIRNGDAFETPHFELTLANQTIDSDSVSIEWLDGTTTKTATCSSGVIIGDATGTLDTELGILKISPESTVPSGTMFNVTYDYQSSVNSTGLSSIPDVDGNVTYDLGTPVEPGTLSFTHTVSPNNIYSITYSADLPTQGGYVGFNYIPATEGNVESEYAASLDHAQQYYPRPIPIKDNGAGILTRYGVAAGTINYTTGEITLDTKTSSKVTQYDYVNSPFSATSNSTQIASVIAGVRFSEVIFMGDITGSTIDATYSDNPTSSSTVETLAAGSLVTNLLTYDSEKIIGSGVRFTFANNTYFNDNNLIYSLDSLSGATSLAGSINRTTGDLTLDSWPENYTPAFDVNSILTTLEPSSVPSVVARVPTAPVRSNSFEIRATTTDGISVVGSADANGEITGAGIVGEINYETGVYSVRFGEEVTADASVADEWWYDASNIDATTGLIFKPSYVSTDTLKYDAVSQSFVPIDPDILGLDPVRLPEDGRVPVYSQGDIVVILNEKTEQITVASNSVYDIGRARIAKLTLTDANGSDLVSDAYDVDMNSGQISFNDLTGLVQPLNLTHRIEDSALVTDVQITGEITLANPIYNDYDADGVTLVSSAVLHGDIFAYVDTPFDQTTWTGEWSNLLIGNQTLAHFNDALFPIEVDNASCVTERWLINFNSDSTVDVIGEFVGQVLTGVSIGSEIAPINPTTGFPYFTIKPEAWGGGWSTGNVLRFNTQSANVPLWIIESVAQGEPSNTDTDALTFCIEFRGDRDAE